MINGNYSKQTRRGFTLIEMLVVISIITLLMALTLPVYGIIMKNARVKATKALIESVSAALAQYYAELECYPPTPANSDLEDQGDLYLYLDGKDGRGIDVNPGTPRAKHIGPFLKIDPIFIKRSQTDDKIVLVDSWGVPLHYFNCKAYIEKKGNPKYCHNPDSFDMFSTGPDKKLDPQHDLPGTALNDDDKSGKIDDASELVDDITNY